MSAGLHHQHHRDQHHHLSQSPNHTQLHTKLSPQPPPARSVSNSHLQAFAGHGMPFPPEHIMTSQSPQVQTMTQRQAPMSGLDALAAGSQYALQQMQHQNIQTIQTQQQQQQQKVEAESSIADDDDDAPDDPRRESIATQKGGRSNSGSVRRRISRACDQCNQLRTKCDGKQPCAHCVGTSHEPFQGVGASN